MQKKKNNFYTNHRIYNIMLHIFIFYFHMFSESELDIDVIILSLKKIKTDT